MRNRSYMPVGVIQESQWEGKKMIIFIRPIRRLLFGFTPSHRMSLAHLLKRQPFRAFDYKRSLNRSIASLRPQLKRAMGKKKSNTPGEEYLLLPSPPSTLGIVDTHTHVAFTFEYYRGRYKAGKHATVYDFVRTMYEGRNVESIVDVWCEAPVRKLWKEFADSALTHEDRQRVWGGIEYWFVIGVFSFFLFYIYQLLGWWWVMNGNRRPSVSSSLSYDALRSAQSITHSHDARSYNDQVEKDMCVGTCSFLIYTWLTWSLSTPFQHWSHGPSSLCWMGRNGAWLSLRQLA